MTALLVVAGAAVGAPARFWLDQQVQRRHEMVFPLGTFVINVLGSLVLGFVLGALHKGAASPAVDALVGTGFCGTFTTFSSFGFETIRLLEEGALFEAFGNVVASVAVGLLAAVSGWFLATAIW